MQLYLLIYPYSISLSLSLSFFFQSLSRILPLLLLPLLFDASTMLNRENRTLKWMPAAGREQLFRGHFPTLLHNAACNFQFGLAKFLDKLLLMSPQRGRTQPQGGQVETGVRTFTVAGIRLRMGRRATNAFCACQSEYKKVSK